VPVPDDYTWEQFLQQVLPAGLAPHFHWCIHIILPLSATIVPIEAFSPARQVQTKLKLAGIDSIFLVSVCLLTPATPALRCSKVGDTSQLTWCAWWGSRAGRK
jgi:hypothetical protein